MKKIFKFSIIVFLFIIYLYVCKIDSIPNSVIIYGRENIHFEDFLGITYKIGSEDLSTMLASSKIGEEAKKENIVEVKLFDVIKLKDVSLNVIDKVKVIPGGQVAGLKLYTNGVMVVGMSEIKAEDGNKYKPYENIGIEEGDRIIKINDEEIENTNHLIDLVNKSNGEKISIEYAKSGEIKNTEIIPVKGKDGKYKIGLWVRDTSAGIGTLSIYEPATGNFAALGHGIADIDTGELVEISNGDFITTNIVSIIKGSKGNPRKNSRYNRKWKINRNNI